jgi:hypothetical protein
MSDIRFNRWLHQSGTGGVYQDSTGNIGIGTSVPTSALDIQSGTIKIGSNTLSSTGVSTFTTVNANSVISNSLSATNIVGVTTAGITTAYIGSINDGPISGARNRIINGDMRIDQRNAGASGTVASFTVDRWIYFASQASKGTWQQNAGSVTPPVGFDYYLGYTSSSSYTLLSGDLFGISQAIEGYNISDLEYGTANAKPITISFWVRSSLTGLLGGFLKNGGTSAGNNTRFCPFSYTINSANTWEYKTITINGDTTGSWESTNGPAFAIGFSLGNGSSYVGGTSGTWSGSIYLQPPDCVDIVATSGATLYLTGVQIEVGTVATPFERRSYGQELALCQRYYQKSYRPTVVPGTTTFDGIEWINGANARISLTTRFAVQMRGQPTIISYDSTGTANRVRTSAGDNQTGYVIRGPSENNFTVDYTSGGVIEVLYHWTASAEI